MFTYRDDIFCKEPCSFSLESANLLRRFMGRKGDTSAPHTSPVAGSWRNSQGSPSSDPQGRPCKVRP